MDRFRKTKGQQGFTLIEMAIVLVIIGLIIGAILKGQDLIANARAKSFASDIRAAEVAQWTWFDRRGSFNGDSNASGLINSTTISPWTGFRNAPSNTITLGSASYRIWYGSGAIATTDNSRNFIAITRSTGPLGDEDLVYVESFGRSIDRIFDHTDYDVICTSVAISSHGTVADALAADSCDGAQAMVYFFD